MNWDRISDTREISDQGYELQRQKGYWMAYAPDCSAPIYAHAEQTFTSNTAEDDREVARKAAEDHFMRT